VVDVGSPVSFHRVVAAGRGCAGGGVVALAELLLPFPSDVSCGCGHLHHLRVGYSSSVLGALSLSALGALLYCPGCIDDCQTLFYLNTKYVLHDLEKKIKGMQAIAEPSTKALSC
jgi:hypothetical protein